MNILEISTKPTKAVLACTIIGPVLGISLHFTSDSDWIIIFLSPPYNSVKYVINYYAPKWHGDVGITHNMLMNGSLHYQPMKLQRQSPVSAVCMIN